MRTKIHGSNLNAAKVQVSTDQPSSREGQQRGPWVALRVAPRVAQTKHEQVDKNGFETAKNYSKLIRRVSEIEGLGLLESEGGPFKIIDFH